MRQSYSLSPSFCPTSFYILVAFPFYPNKKPNQVLNPTNTLPRHKHVNLPLPTNSGIFTGDLTYYSPGPGYGACGFENTSQDAICAVSHLVFDAMAIDSNPNHNPLCGRKIRITRFDEQQGRNNSVDVEVVDRCTGCEPNDIDLSIRMFEILADEGQGRVLGSWAWL